MFKKWHMACLIVVLGTSGAGAGDDDEALYLQRFQAAAGRAMEVYDTLEDVAGPGQPASLPTAGDQRAISPSALEQARAYAAANNSKALLIWHDGRLVAENYFGGTDATTLLVSRSMGKPVSSIAVGRAIALGHIKSLDQPVSDFIPEWRGTPKAKMTVRHVLDMRSGLLGQGSSRDPANIWNRAYMHPRHGDIIIKEYPLTSAPGESYDYSNATGDLTAIVIERATGTRYGEFVSREVLAPLGAAGGKIWVDRPGGLAHSGCCILLPAQTWLRLGIALMNNGTWEGRPYLPAGYVDAMRTTTAANPSYGLGVWASRTYMQRTFYGRPDQGLNSAFQGEPYAAPDVFLFDGNAHQVLYMIPSQKLAILRMGDAPPASPEWDNAVIPNIILRDLASRN